MPLLKHNFHKNILHLFKVSFHKIREIFVYFSNLKINHKNICIIVKPTSQSRQ